MSDKKTLVVSIIIPTRNAESNLEACLASIRSQSHKNMEIVITDNYSNDRTVEIAKKYDTNVIICGPRPPHNNFFTAPIQRKLGAMHASGDFYFFVDADMILDQELLKDCVMKCLSGADAVAIPEISFGDGFWSKCKIAERACYFTPSVDDEVIQAARFFKSITYELVGGWNESVGGFDDWNITLRIRKKGFKISLSNYLILHNEGYLTLRKLVLKKYNMGKCSSVLKYMSSSKSIKAIAIQLTPLRLIMILKRLSKIRKNSHRILFGIMFMKTIEGSAFIMGRIVNAIELKVKA